MSSLSLLKNLSANEETVHLNTVLFSGPVQASSQSPIDDFYAHLRSLVLIGSPESLTQHAALGRVLLLGIVSATEYYFRSIISGIINICPLARAHAYGENVSLGATDYYPKRDIGFALLENHSFSSAKEIKSQTLRLLHLEWKDASSLAAAIREFNTLCQFRHAATHSRGNLASKNFYEIQYPAFSERLSVTVGFEAFQDAASICQNVVRAYNRGIYERLLERWLQHQKLSGNWSKDRGLFEPLYRLFQLTEDFPEGDAKEAHAAVKDVLAFRARRAAKRDTSRDEG